MNDFTKEELEILNTALSVYEKTICGNEPLTRFSSLLKMIKKMIDNYCEHKWEIKVGDEVWFFYTNYGRHSWGDYDTIIYPQEIELISGIIVSIDPYMDSVHIKTKDCDESIDIGLTFFNEWLYKSKNDAINGMVNKMQKLKQ